MDDAKKVDLLWKKFFNSSATDTTIPFFEEPYFNLKTVFGSSVMSGTIPTTSPLGPPRTSNAGVSGNLELVKDAITIPVPGSPNSFYLSSLKFSIPFNYDSNGSYLYHLTKAGGGDIYFGEGDWVVDNDHGTITFFGQLPNGVSIVQPPKISFYRYIGPFGAVADHSALSNLLVDDHTQYALLGGRSGGQTLIGGLTTGNLTLKSNNNGNGSIILGQSEYNELNDRISIGKLNPTSKLDVLINGNEPGLIIKEGVGQTSNTFTILDINNNEKLKWNNNLTITSNAVDAINVTVNGTGISTQAVNAISISNNVTNSIGVRGATSGTNNTNNYGFYSDLTGSATNAYGLYSTLNGTVTNAYGIYSSNPTGTITTAYGMYIENITTGTTNYSIYSAGGENLFTGLITANAGINVTGNITITGTVDGRDVSIDGTALDSHIANTNNPHTVTPAQVGNTTAQWNANQLQSQTISSTVPTTNQILTFNGTQWIPFTHKPNINIVNNTTETPSTNYVILGTFLWNTNMSWTTGNIFFYTTIVNRSLNLRVYDSTNATSLITATYTTTGFYTISFTPPTTNALLELQGFRGTGSGANPLIHSAHLEYNI